ncbi:MAG: hypothetical protein J2P18_03080 [Nocardia sp.]|nr:hypothetical protein [Nocardia sp.]
MTDSNGGAWVPRACTLPTAEQPTRVAEFAELFGGSVLAVRRTGATSLELSLDAGAERTARDLATRETRCCSFFDFDFDRNGGDVLMRVRVGGEHTDVLDGLEAMARRAVSDA